MRLFATALITAFALVATFAGALSFVLYLIQYS